MLTPPHCSVGRDAPTASADRVWWSCTSPAQLREGQPVPRPRPRAASACPWRAGRAAPALQQAGGGRTRQLSFDFTHDVQLEQNLPWQCWGSGRGQQRGGQPRQLSTRICATLGTAGNAMVPSSSCPSRMPGGAGLKWGSSTRGHELPALPASSSPGFRLPQHGAEGTTLITASNESKRLYEGCAGTSPPARSPMLGDTLLLSGTPEHRFVFTEAFLGRPASSFPAMTPKLWFYQCGEAAPTQAVFRGSRNEGTAPVLHQRTSQRAWSRLNLGCNEGCRNSPQA